MVLLHLKCEVEFGVVRGGGSGDGGGGFVGYVFGGIKKEAA